MIQQTGNIGMMTRPGVVLLGVLISSAVFQACASPEPKSAQAAVIDKGAIDRSAAPCEDFYQFACGGWIQNTEIPEDRPQWSRGFADIDERNLELLDSLLKGYAAGGVTPENPYSEKLGIYHAACMDERLAETASMDTLAHWSRELENALAGPGLASELARLHLAGVNAFFEFAPEQDLKYPDQMIAAADQAGLGLPDRDYYLKQDPKTRAIQELYRSHIREMFILWGTAPSAAAQDAKQVYAIEEALAKASMSRVDRRDPEKIYHRLERAGLEKLAPRIDWKAYLKALGYPDIQAVDVKTPEFFSGLNQVLETTRKEPLLTYLRWRLLSAAAPAIGKRFVDEDFRFSSKALTGQKVLAPRWKRCVKSTINAMGFAVGRSFVSVLYGKSGKDSSDRMIRAIEKSFQADLRRISWMDESTRAEALNKLDRVVNQIGYPEKWRDYRALDIVRQSYLKNFFAAESFENSYQLNKIGKPVDRSDWDMPPSAVNAYYDPSMNKMVFPAGVLQPPFFTPGALDYADYSGIGMVMGHELTHGFDDEGRKFDAEGRLRNWWSPKVFRQFDERTGCVVKQYDGFEPQKDVHVNGRLTLGENIADIGGIKLAYAAWLSAHPGAGNADRQNFFIHFAQTWCTKTKPEYERMLIAIDPHSPPRFRVNGPLADLPEFSEVFQCQPGSRMNRPDRCSVW